jgi:peptide-methionine (S)-S-oxide reductase
MLFSRFKRELPSPEDALPGRPERPFAVPERHAVLGTPIEGPYPDHLEVAIFAEGCFWGVERIFWQTPGVWSTAVGYIGGVTPNPTYEEVCSGRTGHTEAVQVVFDPAVVSYRDLLRVFWEGHDPTQGFRQGNDVGTQYRSGIYALNDEQHRVADETRESFGPRLKAAGFGDITTEIVPAGEFYFAEDYHQQYLHKVPGGYCGVGGTGVSCPVGVARTTDGD